MPGPDTRPKTARDRQKANANRVGITLAEWLAVPRAVRRRMLRLADRVERLQQQLKDARP